MAALFPKIYDVITKNPNLYATLRWREPTSTEGSVPELWDLFSLKPLDPPGPLSMLCSRVDPMYEIGSLALKKQIITEQLLILHERVDKELIGRRYPRKKIQDLLAGQVSAQTAPFSKVLEEALCELFQVQKIHCNRRNKSISFSPPDLRLWVSTADRPLVFAEEDNCWIFTPETNILFHDWLTQKQEQGWSIAWPTADGKLEDIKAALISKHIVPDGKLKKEELAHVLGKAQAIDHLRELQMTTC